MPEPQESPLRTELCHLLRDRQVEIRDSYPGLLKDRGGPHYSVRPLEELAETTGQSVDAFLAVLCDEDWAAMDRFVAEIAERRFPQRFPLSEVQKAFGVFRELATRFVTAHFSGDRLDSALGLLNGAVDEAIHRFSDRYQELHLQEIRRTSEELELTHGRLRAQYEEVAEAARIKAQFFANMSHELRSPMNSVIGYTELLLDGVDGPVNDEQRQSLSKILASSRYLLKLINDVLDLSKLEAGKMELQPEPFDVAAVLREAIDTVQPLAYRKRLSLRTEVGAGLERFVGDPDKVKLVLINLLSNAVKFTDEGEVVAAAQRTQRGLQIEVRDTGVGITPGDQERIFHKFYQADTSHGREFRGTGLGLPLSRMLVELMGGAIEVESDPGLGSRFRFAVPEGGPARAAAVGDGALRVLVIEDDPSALELLVRFLEGSDVHVLGAADGEEGLALARQIRPAVITLDLLMPKLDGWTVLGQIRSDEALCDTPVVVVSCLDRREEALRRGADAYVVKPIDREKFVRTVRELAFGGRRRQVAQ